MKIKICIIMIIIMLSAFVLSNVKSLASGDAEIVVSSKNVIEGNNVEIDIDLKKDLEFSAGNFTVTYDDSILSYQGFVIGNSLKKTDNSTNGTIFLNENTKGEIKIGYISEVDQQTETKRAGNLLKLIFNTKVGSGTSTNVNLQATTLKKANGTNVAARIANGTISILSGIELNKTHLDLVVGKTETLTVSALPNSVDISQDEITWESTNTAVAKVNSQGVVTAVNSGTATIKATLLGETVTCSVTVAKPIYINKSTATLPIHQIMQLTLKSDESISNQTVSWTSSNPTVATVTQNGLITALKEGTTTITARIGYQTPTCTIIVSGKLGDLDKDSNITSYDAYKALEASVDYLLDEPIDEQVILLSDVNRNGLPESEDAYRILEYSVGIIDEF